MNELLKLTNDTQFPIDGRELHKSLEIETPYDKWFPRMCAYRFDDGKDFSTKMSESTEGRPAKEHALTLNMAKELCMIQRTEVGKKVCRYLIEVENAYNSPTLMVVRGLQAAQQIIEELKGNVQTLTTENKLLTEEVLRWDARAFVVAAVCSFAMALKCNPADRFAYSWNIFKKELLYRHGININARLTEYRNRTGKITEPKTMDMLEADEMPKAVATIVSLCRESDVDISDLLKNIDYAE